MDAYDLITSGLQLRKLLAKRVEPIMEEYGLTTQKEVPNTKYDAVVLGVAHTEFLQLSIADLKKERAVVYDVKGVLGEQVDGKL